jgi:hypothetical protein
MPAEIDEIESCKYLYLGSIEEPEENQLRIVLLEATTSARIGAERMASESDEILRSLLADAEAIVHIEGCKKFELSWENYIGYSVVNESYSNGEPKSSNGKGRLLVEYERSNYLKYLAEASFATADHPGPYKHWAIYCLNHTIDVAAQVPPKVRLLHVG